MNFIGLDPSLISTAMVVNGKIFNYCREKDAMNKSGYSKWFKYCEDKITFRFIEYRQSENYSDGELIKLKDYDKITDQIIKDGCLLGCSNAVRYSFSNLSGNTDTP